MVEFKENTPTINQVYTYTYRYVGTRFDNMERDILPSKVKIQSRTVYKRNKEGKFSTPRELMTVQSWSAPQYQPYLSVKSKKAKKQMQIKHNYPVYMCIQLNKNDYYSFNESKIVWRCGSYKKYDSHPSQKMVKTVYSETREKINHRAEKLKSVEERKKFIEKEVNKVREQGKYLSVGDYNSQEKKIMEDCYFRDYFIQKKYNCLYGPCTYNEENKKIVFPFFDKHTLAVINLLLKKGILKGGKIDATL